VLYCFLLIVSFPPRPHLLLPLPPDFSMVGKDSLFYVPPSSVRFESLCFLLWPVFSGSFLPGWTPCEDLSFFSRRCDRPLFSLFLVCGRLWSCFLSPIHSPFFFPLRYCIPSKCIDFFVSPFPGKINAAPSSSSPSNSFEFRYPPFPLPFGIYSDIPPTAQRAR